MENFENDKSSNIELEKTNALIEISAIIQIVYQMGANDSEFSKLSEIKNKVESGEISPSEGIVLARQIEQSKMDYH